jgi:hypothetical protein
MFPFVPLCPIPSFPPATHVAYYGCQVNAVMCLRAHARKTDLYQVLPLGQYGLKLLSPKYYALLTPINKDECSIRYLQCTVNVDMDRGTSDLQSR